MRLRVVVGALALWVGAAAEAMAAPAGPKAHVETPRVALGVVAPGEPARAEFRVENRGDTPLTLDAVLPQPFARETRVEVRGSPVPPGKTATVVVVIDTEKAVGAGRVVVELRTDEPDRPPLELVVEVEVRPLLLVRPGHARFVTVQKEAEGTIRQTIAAADGARFRVREVRSPHPSLRTVAREATGEEKGVWQVDLTLDADAPVGALTGEVVVETDHPRQKRARIPVSGFVRPIFAVTPPEAALGEVDPTARSRARLHVKNFATEPIELRSAESTVAGISAAIEPVTPGRVYRVVVTLTPDLAAGDFSGSLRLTTSSAKVPVIEIPLRGRAVRAAQR